MKENLKVTHYNNGDEIPTGLSDSEWTNTEEGSYVIWNYGWDPSVEYYGNLYNWYTVDDDRGICPEGWHVPSDLEYQQLEIYLGMDPDEANNTGWRGTDEGSKLKEAGIEHWNSPNTGATNESGFTALPGGFRTHNDGWFDDLGTDGHFWSSTEQTTTTSWRLKMGHDNSDVYRNHDIKTYGFSVRCMTDIIQGCTHPNASNYDDTANVDDGSCEFETVQIGHQTWMTENLKATHYRNGDAIATELNYSDWSNYNEGAYTYYDGDPSNIDIYGNLYNWNAVQDDRGVCPDGFHIPNLEDIENLSIFLGGDYLAGGKLKETGTEHWSSPNSGATNESGFSGLPGGALGNGSYVNKGLSGYYWSSQIVGDEWGWRARLDYNNTEFTDAYSSKHYGLSIRCLSDELQNVTINVPEDFPTIQGAIDYAIDGDIINVSAGTYYENINFNGKNISVIGEDRETTIIDGGQNGGVVTCENKQEPSFLSGFTIRNGDSNESGSGIRIYHASLNIENVIVENNFTQAWAGGIFIQWSDSSYFKDSIIRNNFSNYRGGGLAILQSNVIVQSVIIDSNSANYGGGVYIDNNDYSNSSILIQNSEISNNHSMASGSFAGGGAMSINDSHDVTINNCTLNNNNSAHSGGAIVLHHADINLNKSIVYDNSSVYGGAISVFYQDSQAEINKSTIIDNSDGLSIYIDEGNANISNSILWSSINGNSIMNVNDIGSISVNYSNVKGSWNGEGNINASPQFDAYYTLQQSSPCIDTGDPDSPLDPDGTRADMGAYPFFHIYGCTDTEAENTDSEANTNDGSCMYRYAIPLQSGQNLLSFLELPEDTSISTTLSSVNTAQSVIAQGEAANNLSGIGWVGSLTSFSKEKGYWLKVNATDEYSILVDHPPHCSEITYNLQAGPNLISFPCPGQYSLNDAIPEEIKASITGIVGQGQAAIGNNGQFIGSLQYLEGSKGYWFIVIKDITLNFQQ